MSPTQVIVELDPDVVVAYNKAPAEEKRKMRSLLSLWLRAAAASSPTSLPTLMDELSDRARTRGMTKDKLESMLGEQ
jgi:hypothetical protein